MGSLFKCLCHDCGESFDRYEGVGRYSMSLICGDCGKAAWIPRTAPRPDSRWRRTDSGNLEVVPIEDVKVVPFNREELKAILDRKIAPGDSDSWLDQELAILVELRNPCECGGAVELASKSARVGAGGFHVAPNTLTRCPTCRSENYAFGEASLWD